MVVAVACGGSSATQIASPIERAVPTAAAVPTAVPTEAAAMPAATEAAEATTAAPVPTGKMGSFPETPFPLLKAPEDNPKRGGVLRYAFYVSMPHFDIHQAASGINTIVQGPMYDNLLRIHPLSSAREVIPDLAHSWDISEDGKTYTFYLREGVKFHDGAPLTSDDVKATFDRIIFPPPGMISPREPNFKVITVKEIRVVDPLTVQFILSEPRSTGLVLSAFTAGYNGIVRKQTLIDNNFDLKRVVDIPTTGPFKFLDYSDLEFFKVEAFEDYWNPELPYLDGIEFLHANFWTPEMAAAMLADRTDYAITLEPQGCQRVIDSGHQCIFYPQTVIFALWMNVERPPLDDARVRRAIHWVLDREALIGVTKNTTPMSTGTGFIFKFNKKYAEADEVLNQRPGYRQGAEREQDIKNAQALLAEAGFPNGEGFPELDLLVRQVAHFDLQAVAIQEMLRTHLNIKTNIRSQAVGVWFEDAEKANFDITNGAVEWASAEPSFAFRSTYGAGASQNYGRWVNEEFENYLDQIDAEVDPPKRLKLIREAELLLEREVPMAPLAFEVITMGYQNYVKGQDVANNIGVYDVTRFDTAWLDK
jgi:ABC-type transport system substrate-binding protein